MGESRELELQKLEWVTLREELNAFHGETFLEKVTRKTNENPLVPIGCFTTAGVLLVGLYSMKTGNVQLSQKMMRARVTAQGLTFATLIVGILYGARAAQ